MDKGVWWGTVLGVTELDATEHTHAHTHTLGSAHLKWAVVILPIIRADDLKTGAYKQDIRLPSLAYQPVYKALSTALSST